MANIKLNSLSASQAETILTHNRFNFQGVKTIYMKIYDAIYINQLTLLDNNQSY